MPFGLSPDIYAQLVQRKIILPPDMSAADPSQQASYAPPPGPPPVSTPPPPPPAAPPTREAQIDQYLAAGLISPYQAQAAKANPRDSLLEQLQRFPRHAAADNSADIAAQKDAAAASVPAADRQELSRFKPTPKTEPEAQPYRDTSHDVPGSDQVTWQGADQGGAGAASMQPAPAKTIPAHEGTAVSPQTEAMMNAAQGEKVAAAQAGGEAEQKQTETAAAGQQATALFQQAQDIETGMQQRRRQAKLNEQQAEYDRMRQEAAAGKPDYDRWWKTKNGGVRALAAVFQALGTFGQGLSHGNAPNMATPIINDAISRDIAEQRDTLAAKREDARAAGESLRQMRERFGDEHLADLGERARQLEAYKLMVQSEVTKMGSPIQAAKAQGIVADLDAEQARLHATMHPWVQAQTVGGAGAGGGYSDVKPDEVIERGGRHFTVPEKDREKVIASINKADDVHQAANSVKTLLSVPITQRGPQWLGEYKAAQKTMAAAEIEAGGKGGKGIFEAFSKAADPMRTLTWTPASEAAVRQIDAAAERGARNAIDASAQFEVTPQLVTSPKGIQERKYRILREHQRGQFGELPGVPPTTFKPAGQ